MENLGSSRSLVIGGTGMLSAATYWLAARSATTLVVARHASRFAAGNHRIVPLDLNWNNQSFADELCRELAASDPIANALLWLHDPAPILRWLIPLLSEYGDMNMGTCHRLTLRDVEVGLETSFHCFSATILLGIELIFAVCLAVLRLESVGKFDNPRHEREAGRSCVRRHD